MDQTASEQANQMCTKHSQKKIKFVQVNDLSSSQNNSLFYCTHCINKDLAFKGINYLLISQIIEESDTNVIQKWPPINDYSVLDKLIQFTELQTSSSSVTHQINQYFTVLKEEFLQKVDLCEKKMINQALLLPFGKQSILKQYQDISQISQLKSILSEGQNRSADNQLRFRQFISEMESKKQRNSELLQNIVEQCQQTDQLISFEYPNLIKNTIFSFIDQIDFFQTKNQANSNCRDNNSNQNTNSSKIMKLISNKSNFCSEDFLSQTQALLDKIDPLLESLSFENMFEQNKNPIDYSALSQNKLDQMKEFVEHQSKIKTNREYQQSIENTQECTLLNQIIHSSTNCVNNSLKEQLQQLFIEIYPLLKQLNFTHETLQKEQLDCISTLSEDQIGNQSQSVKKIQDLNGESEDNLNETKQIINKPRSELNESENNDEIIQKDHIVDQLLQKESKEKPIEIKLMKTKYSDGNNRIEFHKINQFSLFENYNGSCKGCDSNCVSDIVLEKEKKYIFRFKIEHERQDDFYVMFGLIQKINSDSIYGYSEELSCQLINNNNKNQIQYFGQWGIDQHLKGYQLKLSNENEVEMRVWIGGQQLEILDHPNHEYKVALKDKFKINLTEWKDFLLYIGINQDKIKITLTSALEVDHFQ